MSKVVPKNSNVHTLFQKVKCFDWYTKASGSGDWGFRAFSYHFMPITQYKVHVRTNNVLPFTANAGLSSVHRSTVNGPLHVPVTLLTQ